MNDCERIRELLPSLVRGELSARDAIISQTHADSCAECSSELRLVRLIADTMAPVPAGLEERVITAVRTARPVQQMRRWTPARLAMAATIAAAMIGGSAIYQRMRIGGPATGEMLSMNDASYAGWAAAEDAMLHGGSAIQEMSVQELELILAELDQ
jgi:hypothetical protein